MAKELTRTRNIDPIERREGNHQALTWLEVEPSPTNVARQGSDNSTGLEALDDLPWWGKIVLGLIITLCEVIGLIVTVPLAIIGLLWDLLP